MIASATSFCTKFLLRFREAEIRVKRALSGQGIWDSRHDNSHWAAVAKLSEDKLKGVLISGYSPGDPLPQHNYHFFSPGCLAEKVLDFGCGIGRNFPALLNVSKELVAFDIPEMISACRQVTDCEMVTLCDDWEVVRQQRFDVVVATLTFQHISDRKALESYLQELASICDFLYISSRCWIDGRAHYNTYRVIKDCELFTYIKGTLTEDEVLDRNYPDECHYEILLRTKNTKQHRDRNARIFDIHTMEYPPTSLRLDITLTQLFTPNYDHWAFKVLENKRVYCERHGYQFHYHRGLYDHALDRHPSWHRIPMILELFEDAGTDWVFWSDIDSLIMRPDIRLERLIAENADKSLIVPNQGAGLYLDNVVEECLCFGQFFLRNCEWSRNFLRRLWEFPTEFGYERYLVEQSWEQEAVNYFWKYNLLAFSDHAAVVPNRVFNSFYNTQYIEGDYIIHFAGEAARGEGKRESLIDEYLDILSRNDDQSLS